MKSIILTFFRIFSFLGTLWIWQIFLSHHFIPGITLAIIIGTMVLVFPVVWFSRKILDAKPTMERLGWITTCVHMILMILLGISMIKAIMFFSIMPGLILPFPRDVALVLLYCTGCISLLTVINLAASGLGAPFAIALSKRIADRWMYRWTRNPMVLSTYATLLAAGLFFQSLYFVLWVLLLVVPAWIYFLKVYEERELEIRFGAPYLEYKARTAFLWPRRPKA
jgi:protein-S-isoprenylcysteine O-methyltransferase Ste14